MKRVPLPDETLLASFPFPDTTPSNVIDIRAVRFTAPLLGSLDVQWELAAYDSQRLDASSVLTLNLMDGATTMAKFQASYTEKKENVHRLRESGDPVRTFWDLGFRRVAPEHRGHGYGPLALTLMEYGIRKIMRMCPETYKPEYIQIDTAVSTTARMIVDHRWVEERGLSTIATRMQQRPDFHYLPHPVDADEAERVLLANVQSADDLKGIVHQMIRFTKPI